MMHGTINIKLTAYSRICWLLHRTYYDARNHKHKIFTAYLKHSTINKHLNTISGAQSEQISHSAKLQSLP